MHHGQTETKQRNSRELYLTLHELRNLYICSATFFVQSFRLHIMLQNCAVWTVHSVVDGGCRLTLSPRGDHATISTRKRRLVLLKRDGWQFSVLKDFSPLKLTGPAEPPPQPAWCEVCFVSSAGASLATRLLCLPVIWSKIVLTALFFLRAGLKRRNCCFRGLCSSAVHPDQVLGRKQLRRRPCLRPKPRSLWLLFSTLVLLPMVEYLSYPMRGKANH